MSLREKAEAVTSADFAGELAWLNQRIGWLEPKVGEFIAAADPPTVLALLDLLDAYRELVAARDDLRTQPVEQENAWEKGHRLNAARARVAELERGDAEGDGRG